MLNGSVLHKEASPQGRIQSSFEAELFRIFEFLVARIGHLYGVKLIAVSTDSQSSISLLNSADSPNPHTSLSTIGGAHATFTPELGFPSFGFARGILVFSVVYFLIKRPICED